MNKSNTLGYPKPSRINKYKFMELFLSDNILVTPKIDGFQTNIKVNDNLLVAECIKFDDVELYFVFDNLTLLKKNKNKYERLKQTAKLINNNIQEFCIFTKKSFGNWVDNINSNINKNKKKIFLKPFYFMNDFTNNEKNLEIINSMFEIESFEILGNKILLDGIIIESLNFSKKIYKIKPVKHNTVDLYLNGKKLYATQSNNTYKINDNLSGTDLINNKIYRCRFASNETMDILEIRNDKKFPNHYKHIEEVYNYYKDPWKPIELKEILPNIVFYKKYSQDIDDQTKKFFFRLSNEIDHYIIGKINEHDHVIDLGAGDGKIYSKLKNNDIYIDCIEVDPIRANRFRHANNVNYFIKSFTDKDFLNGILLNGKKILFLMRFSFQTLNNSTKIKNFLTEIRHFCKENQDKEFNFLICDYSPSYEYDNPIYKTIKLDNNKYTIQTKYSKNVFTQRIYRSKDIVDILKDYGFILSDSYELKQDYSYDWEKQIFVDHHIEYFHFSK